MIKSLRDLDSNEMSMVVKYLKKDNESITEEEILKDGNTKIYNFGEGVLFYFKDEEVVGSVKIVLEVVKHLSVIYIYYLTIDKDNKYKKTIVKELIEKGISIGEDKGCRSIILGLNDDEILAIGKELGYIPSYSAYKMVLKNRDLTYKTLELIKLDNDNKEEYLDVFNDSFSDMPHGCYYELSDVDKCLDDNNEYFLVSSGDTVIGFMSYEIEDNVGSFDIGLCKKYRGRGYGKRLLETAIDSLNKRNVDKVTLTVIEQNKRALHMYYNRGFEIEKNLCRWIVVK